jgi:hypothetical protein
MHDSGASRRGNAESHLTKYERATLSLVIARAKRAIQYSRDADD